MKIITWNVNGIRSAAKQGFWKWFSDTNADIICLQELKADEAVIKKISEITGFKGFFNLASKKGYSGTAIYVKNMYRERYKNLKLNQRQFDTEGRYLELGFKDWVLINIYIPHGGRQKEKLNYKLEVYKFLLEKLRKLSGKNIIVCGDFNIALEEIDLARPRNNKNNIMFTPEERVTLDKLINTGFVDSFREFEKRGGYYTWWPWMANCRKRNLGWRIDYVFVDKKLRSNLDNAYILNDVFGSDHCPIGIDLKK